MREGGTSNQSLTEHPRGGCGRSAMQKRPSERERRESERERSELRLPQRQPGEITSQGTLLSLSPSLSLISIQLLPRVVVALPSVKSLISNASPGEKKKKRKEKKRKKRGKKEKVQKKEKKARRKKEGERKQAPLPPGCILIQQSRNFMEFSPCLPCGG